MIEGKKMIIAGKELIRNHLTRTIEAINSLDESKLTFFAEKIIETLAKKKTIFFAGNGGSASTASHFVNDLLTAYTYEQTAERPLTNKKAKIQSLTESTGIVTGLTNDFNFYDIFVNQLRTISDSGDMLVVITASGNSQNLLNAVSYANDNGIFTVAIVGFDGGKVLKTAQLVIHAKTDQGDYGPAEDVHLVVNHAVASLVRDKLYRK
jgi:D-sedoheptulose 7-phosphate isomerase